MWILEFFVAIISVMFSKNIDSYRYGPPEKVFIDERPFQAGILKNGVYKCGATIISLRCVLTACSCVEYTAKPTQNVTDDVYTLVSSLMYMDVDLKVRHVPNASIIFSVDGCNNQNEEKDAAILCSEEPLHGLPVVLAQKEAMKDSKVVVSGWGLTSSLETETLKTIELRASAMNVISLEECRQRYDGVRTVPDGVFCAVASHEVRGFCEGDVGAPLTYGNSIIGVAVTSFGCGESKYPAIFTSVSRINTNIVNIINDFEDEFGF